MPAPKDLGKLVAIHGTSPVFLQRAAIVAVLSFLFFGAMLFAFYVRGNFGYFLLSTAFLIVYVFTMIGWWMQKRNAVEIYANGLKYRGSALNWTDIENVEHSPESGITITTADGSTMIIPASIVESEKIAAYIRQKHER